MISASRPHQPALAAVCSALLAGGLAGCVSTQQKASWLHIQDARIIAAQSSTVVRTESPSVRVDRVSVLRRGPQAVFVVRLQNLTDHALSDLPISIGFLTHGRRVYLNHGRDLAYFATHLASVDAHSMITWVFNTRLQAPAPGRAFALVGPHPVPSVGLGRRLPDLRVTLSKAPGGRVHLSVTNRSSVPQPQLPVYAVAASNGRITAAGQTAIADLGAGQTAHVQIGLIGRANSNLQLEALPTMFLP